ncbi:MAG: pyruvate, phosphate dikinase [Opitutales bacterium]|nr:pyruvate, phosphate dikinase [Opitutales bacterium]
MATANTNEQSPSGSAKYIYDFGQKTDGNGKMKALLGGKGANLAEMARIGLPVPPGFTITTEVCTWYYANGRKYPESLAQGVRDSVALVEAQVGRKFGDSADPLLFSVRSGARESMPGMMDTILNLGLNDAAVVGLANKTGNPRFAWDCYRRFINMYGDVVMGVQSRTEHEHEPFDAVMSTLKKECGAVQDNDLSTENLQELVRRYKALIIERTGSAFPEDPYTQLWGAVGAVFGSWNNDRAKVYRQKYNIPAEWGTAVNIQTMVFGNKGDTSATGVAFTRDPANGTKVFYGEYLVNAQGEDVVAGIRTPKPIAAMADEMPASHAELEKVRARLEEHFRDMQDFEFTIEEGKLYMLQTRNGKRTGLAAVRIAFEMVEEGLIDQRTAVTRIPADSITSLLAPTFDDKARNKAVKMSKGLPAGPGAATGRICFSASAAEARAKAGDKVILCRVETTPEDLRGMIAAEGILTSRGGVSSHAALVARQMGKVCVCGAHEVVIDYAHATLTVGKEVLSNGDYISIDGTTGEIFKGRVNTAPSEVTQVLEGRLAAEKSHTYGIFAAIMGWADQYRRLDVRANADSPGQATAAISLGAQGIGLCRTEHMFFEGDRIDSMREMILASDATERSAALDKLLPYQRDDFYGIFKAMGGRPVTIRLLDPPLHEFLPHDSAARNALAEKLHMSTEVIADRVNALHEQNPMLGHRGCRLGVTYPEITRMQARAIFEAAAQCVKEGAALEVEVMVPLIAFEKELADQASLIHAVAADVMAEQGVKFDYLVGSMIEVPRAALRAGNIARQAQFFSFGTNDLTQTTLGMSRDDMGSFLPDYQDKEILNSNPFASIDVGGVGQLVEMGVDRARATNPKIKLGICGEHGGDPLSIFFFDEVGLDYVSCSPPRVPVARLAAAQAALKREAASIAAK